MPDQFSVIGETQATYLVFTIQFNYFSFPGFVYYELDCFARLRNPFLPLDVEDPTVYHKLQRNLTGEGREERINVWKRAKKGGEKLLHPFKIAKKEDHEALKKFYELICDDISSQRTRVGGDWAVAGILIKKDHRDLVR